MELESRTKALIAVGAAVSANCQSCLQSALELARQGGANEREISVAIEVGKGIRQGAAAKMDKIASELIHPLHPFTATTGGRCECGLL